MLGRRALLAWLGSAGLPAAALEPLLARTAPAHIDPRPYLVSEKLDGVRALWDGQVLRFRSGRTVAAPAWFLAQLPRQALDGELWTARRGFDALSGTVRRTEPVDAEWRRVRFHVFELPNGEGSFEQRVEKLKTLAGGVVVPVEHMRLASNAALRDKLKEVIAAGGEGLMLHRADAPLAAGRSDLLLKLKPHEDAEAVVVGQEPGKGRFAGQLGALELQTPDGIRFKLGTGFSDAQRRNPPPIGATVTYRFRDRTPAGKPRFASFLRMADDF
ncbi:MULTISPECIES: DNA ligase [unclassified Roseateles]|uniref:DNA ligase n=1 Tax=unclassified Roseateles TaxID=2626991 RepID=UPI0006FB2DD9|nr:MULTISPECIES: DNA ligase [unclassified Roseateles]KQW43476.1 ATP-dependent DNA ligase [Pelomonas sp. Root405]KRA71214.1 ATP-dependent DNA ligase [Pelomonas sp. Root662]